MLPETPPLGTLPPAAHRTRFRLLTASAAPVALALGLLLLPRLNPALELFRFHSLLVGAVATLALLLTLATLLAGVRQRNVQVVLLSLASGSLCMVYAVHGLASPEVGVPGVQPLHGGTSMPGMGMGGMGGPTGTPVLPLAAQLGALLTSCWLCLSVLPSDSAALRGLLRLRAVLLVCWLTGLAGLAGLLLLAPERASGLLSSPGEHAALVVSTLLLCGVTARRYWRSWRYSRFPLQLSVVYAALWLGGAQLVILLGPAWTLSWWIYHFLLVGVTAAILAGLVVQGHRPDLPLGTALRGLWNNRPDDLLASGISPSVQALVASTEAHDPYTAGHSYRVALHALRLARACGHSPEALRAVTQGGILHDLGKLDVPSHILTHPERLSPADRAVTEQHPLRGYERCRVLGFLPEELGIVRSHHERWDGRGYPDRLAGRAIPELARLLSVADVYDALTSQRSYRDPWSHEQANAYIREQSGHMFDPGLVTVWLSLPPLAAPPQEEASRNWSWPLPTRPGAKATDIRTA